MEKYIKMLEKTKMAINKDMIIMEREKIEDITENKKYIELGNFLESIAQLQNKFIKRSKKIKLII